jgi:hypothetical protein
MILNTTGTVRQLVDGDFENQLRRIEDAVQDLVDNRWTRSSSAARRFTACPSAPTALWEKLSENTACLSLPA